MGRVYSSNRWFDLDINRTTYYKRIIGISVRIWKFYFEVGRLLPMETRPLTDEERELIKEMEDDAEQDQV